MLDSHTQHPPGPSSHPHSWKMDHLPPPVKEVSQGLGSTVGHAPEAGVIQGRLEGVCLGTLQEEIGLKSSAQCKGSPIELLGWTLPPPQQKRAQLIGPPQSKPRTSKVSMQAV